MVSRYHPRREIPTKDGRSVTLEGYEVFLYDTAQQLLRSKPDSPVVMFDVGGGTGSTWNRLALAMQKDVDDSRIAFVVSNMLSTPDQQIGSHGILRTSSTVKVRYDLNKLKEELNSARNYVNFINGRFGNLHRQMITLPNGTQFNLKGNVDFLNEKYSVTTHSFIPELDITRMARLLSPFGVYSVNKDSAPNDSVVDFFIPQRQQGIEFAHKVLQTDIGLRKISTIEAGKFEGQPFTNHQIFKASQAPLLSVE